MDVDRIIGRNRDLFTDDYRNHWDEIHDVINGSKVLVVGAAGTIGQAVTRELFTLNPASLHCVDISENNLVELVRSLRSSNCQSLAEFKTFAIDAGGPEFEALLRDLGPYDFVFNLSALKHVRSEKDPYTLMRMIQVNIFNTIRTIDLIKNTPCKKYFSVSTDKASNPANLMGASKRIMELLLMRDSSQQVISMARFANVAFSDGSLLHGFNQRISKLQPISAPSDIKRFFIKPHEAGKLCVMSSIFGENRDIFFPAADQELFLENFAELAVRYLTTLGYEPQLCSSEEEARKLCEQVIKHKKWPVYFFKSDTSGEKPFEEFYTQSEVVDFSRFSDIGIVKNNYSVDGKRLDLFLERSRDLINKRKYDKRDIIAIFEETLPELNHIDTGKSLDERM